MVAELVITMNLNITFQKMSLRMDQFKETHLYLPLEFIQLQATLEDVSILSIIVHLLAVVLTLKVKFHFFMEKLKLE